MGDDGVTSSKGKKWEAELEESDGERERKRDHVRVLLYSNLRCQKCRDC